MDPNNTNNPVQPIVAQSLQPNQAPYSASSVPVTPTQKSKKGLIIGLAIGIPLLLMTVAAMLFAALALPRMQGVAFSNAFMSDITAGNIDQAVLATRDESSRTFITASSEKLKGQSYSLTDNEYNADADSYYLYKMTGGEQISARVVTTFNDGKRTVKSLVYSATTLSLKPETTDQAAAIPSATQPANAKQCFAPSDYDAALGWDNTVSFTTKSPYTANIHFLPDSLNYIDSQQQSYLDTMASIVKNNPGKDYGITLYGSVATTAASDANFANQRAEKIKNALVAAGVDTKNITINPAQNVSGMGGAADEVALQTARVVVIQFAPTCTIDDEQTPASNNR